MLLRRQHPCHKGHFFPITGHIADLLRHDEVHLTGEAILQQTAPLFGVLHVRGGHSPIHIEIHQCPLRAQGNIVHILLDMLFQIVLMSGLIEIPDVHPDLIRRISTNGILSSIIISCTVPSFPLQLHPSCILHR